MEYLELVLRIVAGLAGFPALLAAVINFLKWVGWLPDGAAPTANMIGHLIAYVGVGVAVILGKIDILPGLDLQLGALANVLLAVLAFLSSLRVAVVVNNRVLRGLPLVGHSYAPVYPWEADE